MAKTKSAFFCQQCGYESPKWTGKCPSCGAWNSFVEEIIQREDKNKTEVVSWDDSKEKPKAHKMDDLTSEQEMRMLLPDSELNRVLGGGLVPGSVVLIAGEPGIGKSTLFLSVRCNGKMLLVFMYPAKSLRNR